MQSAPIQPTTSEKAEKVRPEHPTEDTKESKKKKKDSTLHVKKEKTPLSKFWRWTPQDDLYLIDAVQQGLEPEEIVTCCKFSFKFTLPEVMERWKSILQTAKLVHLLRTTSKRAPWTKEEDDLIFDEFKKKGTISFVHLLDQNRDKFHPTRTPKSLEAHFYRIKRIGNLGEFDKDSDKNMESHEIPEEEEVESYDQFETSTMESYPSKQVGVKDIQVKSEKKNAKLALKLEKELEMNLLDKDVEYYAILEGEKYKFRIKKISNTIGRSDAKSSAVDINLEKCGESSGKISRKQALITLVFDGNGAKFVIKNEGKKPIFVNDTQLNTGESKQLLNNEMIGFPGDIKFLFNVNQNAISKWLKDQNLVPNVKKTVVVVKDEVIMTIPETTGQSEHDVVEEILEPPPQVEIREDLMDII